MHQTPLYKTKMCPIQEPLQCLRKAKCAYAHSVAELRQFYHGRDLRPVDFTWHTRLCPDADLCSKQICADAHSEQEIRPVPCKYQSLCKHWKKCPYTHYFEKPQWRVPDPIPVNSSRLSSFYDRVMKDLDTMEARLDAMLIAVENQFDHQIQQIDARIALNEAITTPRPPPPRNPPVPPKGSWANDDSSTDEDEKPSVVSWTAIVSHTVIYPRSSAIPRYAPPTPQAYHRQKRKRRPAYKTELCWLLEKCPYKSRCWYAHTDKELLPR